MGTNESIHILEMGNETSETKLTVSVKNDVSIDESNQMEVENIPMSEDIISALANQTLPMKENNISIIDKYVSLTDTNNWVQKDTISKADKDDSVVTKNVEEMVRISMEDTSSVMNKNVSIQKENIAN